ncbi:MAG: hypothetical protein FWD73_10065 [Polyangiaceae bacterium]|nr:hypothetical protein [Polyangiaceae bacterium]
MTQKNEEYLTFDVRVRERNLNAGAITEADLEKYYASLPDLADQAQPFNTLQPALAQPEPPMHADTAHVDTARAADTAHADTAYADPTDKSTFDAENAPAPEPPEPEEAPSEEHALVKADDEDSSPSEETTDPTT